MLPKSLQNLIDEFSKLPGVGPKSAARLAFYLLTKPDDEIKSLGSAVSALKDSLKYCRSCYNVAEDEVCLICLDGKRDKTLIAVVEEPLDVIALERAAGFSGIYHVLGGSISPIDGIGPSELRMNELFDRIKKDGIKEIVLATNTDFEGEATASYIKEKISALGKEIEITRIARGLPVGGDLEYADEVTLKRSLEGRRRY